MVGDAVIGQVLHELAHLLVDLAVGVPLVLVDDVLLVGVCSRRLPERPHRGRGGGEGLHRDTPHLDGGGVERGLRGVEFGPGGQVVVDHPVILAEL